MNFTGEKVARSPRGFLPVGLEIFSRSGFGRGVRARLLFEIPAILSDFLGMGDNRPFGLE
jgi:hypothetical protein